MTLCSIFLVLSLAPLILGSIFVYHTEDSPAVEVYDCLYHHSTFYCRRPSDPIALHRDNDSHHCHAGGIHHSFRSLRANNITVNTVLHEWRSTLDKAEEYSHYLRQPIDAEEGDRSLCQCIDPQSFGKTCEYLLPLDTSLTDTLDAKFTGNSLSKSKLMYVGDIVCYSTLKCDFGLLCLDWRDVCDSVQQCMSGLDEENCDKLEFNECEEDEYRCMNGMCIPGEYFLDGEYDCMDMSDEKERFSHTKCSMQSASAECDDRLCPPNWWSCGDGQCIRDRHLRSNGQLNVVYCLNRRDQFFWCEGVNDENLQTESNGRCSVFTANATHAVEQYCAHLLMCARRGSEKQHCACRKPKDQCSELHKSHCSQPGLVRYPNGALVTPYLLQSYTIAYDPWSITVVTQRNGTIKCRGALYNFTDYYSGDLNSMPMSKVEFIFCISAPKRSSMHDEGYHPYCYNDSRTFNNRSYRWIDFCDELTPCISACRIKD